MTDGQPLYVVGDVHGHLAELHRALENANLITTSGSWCGGQARLWFLGDLVDRGPDGLAVLEFANRLGTQAGTVGGHVTSLLGNHEILLMGARHFGDTTTPDAPRGFLGHWLRNGGQPSDFTGITDRHLSWLVDRPAVALVNDHLLLHADTAGYLDYGDTIDDINHEIQAILSGRQLDAWWTCFRRLTQRGDFATPTGTAAARLLRDKLGGRWIVHGHTTIADLRNIQPTEITAAYTYANGAVIATDSAVYEGGPCLVTQLPIVRDTRQP